MPNSASDPGNPLNSRGLSFDDYVSLWWLDTDSNGVNDYEDIDPVYQDCDDTDAATYPGGLEILDDSKDGDCDGDPNRTPFGFDDIGWDLPRTPRIVRTDTDYVMVTVTDVLDLTFNVSEKVGAALTFPVDSGYQALTTGVILWHPGTGLPLGTHVDAEADGANFWSNATYQFIGATGYITVTRRDYSPSFATYTAGPLEWEPVNNAYNGTAVDMVLDSNGHPWATGCGFDTVQAIRGNALSADPIDSADLAPDLTGQNAPSAGVCFWAGDPVASTGIGQVVVCDPGVDCITHDFDTAAATPTLTPVMGGDLWAGRALDYGKYQGGWHHLLVTGNPGARIEQGATGYDLFSSYNLDSIDAVWRDTDGDAIDDTLYAVGVGSPVVSDGQGPRVILTYGDPSGAMTDRVLAFTDPYRPDLVPTGAGIHADADRLVIGVAADSAYYAQDAIGWVFFGMP